MTHTKKNAKPTIGFIGAGKMGEAILVSLLRAKITTPGNILVCDPAPGRTKELERKHRIIPACVTACVAESDIVFLAVKPQELGTILKEIAKAEAEYGADPAPLYISIAAGRRLDWMEAFLPASRIVRAMPNLAVSVGLGMTAFCGGKNTTAADMKCAEKLLGCTGKAVALPEEQLDAVTAVSGSGPAFFAYMLQAMIDGGVEIGLPPDAAKTLAMQTMLGTATVLATGETEVPDFINAVASPKGTTAEGLDVLEKSTLRGIVKKTLAAAKRRSGELSRM